MPLGFSREPQTGRYPRDVEGCRVFHLAVVRCHWEGGFEFAVPRRPRGRAALRSRVPLRDSVPARKPITRIRQPASDSRNTASGDDFQVAVVAVHAGETRTGSFVERDADLHPRHGVYQCFVEILYRPDEVTCTEDDIGAFGYFEADRMKLHFAILWHGVAGRIGISGLPCC